MLTKCSSFIFPFWSSEQFAKCFFSKNGSITGTLQMFFLFFPYSKNKIFHTKIYQSKKAHFLELVHFWSGYFFCGFSLRNVLILFLVDSFGHSQHSNQQNYCNNSETQFHSYCCNACSIIKPYTSKRKYDTLINLLQCLKQWCVQSSHKHLI